MLIELKTDIGSQSPEQRKWEIAVKAAGYSYHICRSLADFITLT
jgi:hypothetical protein